MTSFFPKVSNFAKIYKNNCQNLSQLHPYDANDVFPLLIWFHFGLGYIIYQVNSVEF
jgi:hypothetical protein